MSPLDLLQWWNLIFDLPFVAALIPLLLQATGAAHLGHAGHGVHVGHAGHNVHMPHLGHHVQAGVHSTPTSPAGHEVVHTHTQVEHSGLLSRAFGLLGVGKVPIMMVFSSFSFVWGFIGVASNLFFNKVLPPPELFIWPSVLVSLFCALCFTSVLSQGFARLMPSVETYGTSREELVGRNAHTLYEISANSGAAVVLDAHSNRVQIKCRVEDAEIIPRGAIVAIIRYDEQQEAFFVRQETPALDSSPTQKQLN